MADVLTLTLTLTLGLFPLLPVVNSTRLLGDLINSGTGDIKKTGKR